MTSRPQPSDPPPLASSDALRRAALARSAARGAVVARRRLAWRWTCFLLGRAVLWLGLPLALAAGGWWWWQQPPTRAARWPAALPAPAGSAVQAASAPAAEAAAAASDALSLPASAALPASAPASAAASQPLAN